MDFGEAYRNINESNRKCDVNINSRSNNNNNNHSKNNDNRSRSYTNCNPYRILNRAHPLSVEPSIEALPVRCVFAQQRNRGKPQIAAYKPPKIDENIYNAFFRIRFSKRNKDAISMRTNNIINNGDQLQVERWRHPTAYLSFSARHIIIKNVEVWIGCISPDIANKRNYLLSVVTDASPCLTTGNYTDTQDTGKETQLTVTFRLDVVTTHYVKEVIKNLTQIAKEFALRSRD